MKKNIKIWGILCIFILNMILSIIPAESVWAMENDEYVTVKIKEKIKYLLTGDDKILLINENGQAILRKDEIDIRIEGNNFKVLTNNLIIDDENKIYNISNEEFLDAEVTKKYLLDINYLQEEYKFDDIFFFYNKIGIKVKDKDSYTVIYLQKINDVYMEVGKVENIETSNIYIDKDGQLYVKRENSLLKYNNEEYKEVINFSCDYYYSIYDDNNIIAYNNSEYIELKLSNSSNQENNEHKEILEDTKYENLISDINIDSELENSFYSIENQPSGESINYQSHIQNIGWQGWKSNGELSGSQGKSYRLEAIRVKGSNLPKGASITYRSHIEYIGWQDWKYDGDLSGTEGQGKRLEGIEIKLLNVPDEYHVEYRVHIQDIGWQQWKRDGDLAGTVGKSKRIEAIEIKIVKESELISVSYSVLSKDEGWSETFENGGYVGSTLSNPLKAFKINLSVMGEDISVRYRVHVQNEGWDSWVKSGEIAGNIVNNRLLEAFEIQLVNAPSNYHILYRANIKGYGWQGWKCDGAQAGTTGLSGQIIGIEIKVIKDIEQPSIKYTSHVQNVGWQGYKQNGELSGTEGKNLRLEGIKIELDNLEGANSIMYKTHVQNMGWQDWSSDGNVSGTEGKGYRLEAIQIKLKKEIVGYKLYYRVHVQDYGWQDWRTNEEIAGTVGCSKRIEAIEIKLVKDKNKSIVIDAGHNYGGDDGAYATHNGIKYVERDLNMSVASKLKRALEANGFEVIMTRNHSDRETISLRQSLAKRVNIANYLNGDFFISIHQNSAASSSANGVEVYYSSAIPLSGGVLLKSGVEYNNLQSKSYVASEKVSKSKLISKSIVDSISKQMERNNRGIYDRDFYVIKNTHMPSVLVECGFISNASEAKKLATDSLQQTMAEIMATEISKQF